MHGSDLLQMLNVNVKVNVNVCYWDDTYCRVALSRKRGVGSETYKAMSIHSAQYMHKLGAWTSNSNNRQH